MFVYLKQTNPNIFKSLTRENIKIHEGLAYHKIYNQNSEYAKNCSLGFMSVFAILLHQFIILMVFLVQSSFL